MALTIDSREPKFRVESIRAVLPDAVVRRLDTGDVELSCDGHVEGWEIKTIGSLQAAVVGAHSDGRSILEAELSSLAATYEYRRLVVIGNAWPSSNGKLQHEKMSSAQQESAGWLYTTYLRILDSAADHGTPVVQLPSEYAYVLWVSSRYKAFSTKHAPRAIKSKAVFAYRTEEVAPLRVLSAFPGVGPATARTWWKEAGTVRQAIIQGMSGARRQTIEVVLEMTYAALTGDGGEKPNPSQVINQAEFKQAQSELFG